MHDQIFWSADRDAFSPFQRVTSAVVSSLIIVGLVVGVVAASGLA
jgi:hypothetical protein